MTSGNDPPSIYKKIYRDCLPVLETFCGWSGIALKQKVHTPFPDGGAILRVYAVLELIDPETGPVEARVVIVPQGMFTEHGGRMLATMMKVVFGQVEEGSDQPFVPIVFSDTTPDRFKVIRRWYGRMCGGNLLCVTPEGMNCE